MLRSLGRAVNDHSLYRPESTGPPRAGVWREKLLREVLNKHILIQSIERVSNMYALYMLFNYMELNKPLSSYENQCGR